MDRVCIRFARLSMVIACIAVAAFASATIVSYEEEHYSSFLIKNVKRAKSIIEVSASSLGKNLIDEIRRAALRGVEVTLILPELPSQLANVKNVSLVSPGDYRFFPHKSLALDGEKLATKTSTDNSGMIIDGTTMISSTTKDIANDKVRLEEVYSSDGGMTFLRDARWAITKKKG